MQRASSAVIQSFYEIADLLILGTLLIGVLTIANLESMPAGLESFLKARVTVNNAILAIAFLLICHFLFRLIGLYNANIGRSFRTQACRVLWASSLASLFALMFPAMSKSHAFTWPLVLYFWVATTTASIGLRAAVRVVKKYIVTQPRQVIIVGSGPKALTLYHQIQGGAERQYTVLGFVDSPNSHRVPKEIQRRMLGPIENLDKILMNRVVDHVMIALPIKSRYEDIQRAITVCEEAGVESEYLSGDDFQLSVAWAQIGNLDSHSVIRFKVVEDDYRLVIKRLIDIVGTCVGLICFAPLMLLIAVLIRLTSPGPALFVQERYGLNKRRFGMWKFRTMVFDAEALQATLEASNEAQGPVFKIRRDPRVTPLGRLLRKTSLDELPQLINVLRGEMSLVGPRPLPHRDVSRFEASHLMRRFSVKPGLTCLWQVNGRSDKPFSYWIAQDLKYIDSWSLTLDFKILAKTIPAVLRGTGAA